MLTRNGTFRTGQYHAVPLPALPTEDWYAPRLWSEGSEDGGQQTEARALCSPATTDISKTILED